MFVSNILAVSHIDFMSFMSLVFFSSLCLSSSNKVIYDAFTRPCFGRCMIHEQYMKEKVAHMHIFYPQREKSEKNKIKIKPCSPEVIADHLLIHCITVVIGVWFWGIHSSLHSIPVYFCLRV